MKRFLIAMIAAGAGVSGAFAADMPRPYTKAPPIAAPYDWSGFYVGGNGGYGWAVDHRQESDTAFGQIDFGRNKLGGGFAGGQAGYRLQTGQWIFGVEAQGDWADINESTDISRIVVNSNASMDSKIDSFGLFTGQIGYALNNTLLYFKGGGAVVNQTFGFINIAKVLGPVSTSSKIWGGAVGGGIEFGFTPNWSAALEYNHIFLDRQPLRFAAVTVGVPSAAYTGGGDADLVSVRINYHFDSVRAGSDRAKF